MVEEEPAPLLKRENFLEYCRDISIEFRDTSAHYNMTYLAFLFEMAIQEATNNIVSFPDGTTRPDHSDSHRV